MKKMMSMRRAVIKTRTTIKRRKSARERGRTTSSKLASLNSRRMVLTFLLLREVLTSQ
jgi:hypothetical protein